jgi:hypothetical protein
MKTVSKQASLDLESILKLTVQGIGSGIPFRFCATKTVASGDIHIRVKPVNFLLNSTLVVDCINRQKCFVVNIEKGTVFVVEGDRFIEKVEAVIQTP